MHQLQHVSPKLLRAHNFQLAVPGTYRETYRHGVVRISCFSPTVKVITSKQRPRQMTIFGSDGQEYPFLLKGHEDLRQDERVMQLFGLVNALLGQDKATARQGLAIRRYSVMPLSNNSGVIGWVPGCDTLQQLIRDYRESRDIPIDLEKRMIWAITVPSDDGRERPTRLDFDKLGPIQKAEVFGDALAKTQGVDLARMLWLCSQRSEDWLARRTNFTRSLAVMCMAGYILGLGDRHLANIMLERATGKIVHIDFGDCFEVGNCCHGGNLPFFFFF
jgi:FKBP12-rapamycin complex-associated protein